METEKLKTQITLLKNCFSCNCGRNFLSSIFIKSNISKTYLSSSMNGEGTIKCKKSQCICTVKSSNDNQTSQFKNQKNKKPVCAIVCNPANTALEIFAAVWVFITHTHKHNSGYFLYVPRQSKKFFTVWMTKLNWKKTKNTGGNLSSFPSLVRVHFSPL